MTAASTQLTAYDRNVLARAREMAALDLDTVRAFTGYDDSHEALVAAFTRAQIRISELLGLIEDLTGNRQACRKPPHPGG